MIDFEKKYNEAMERAKEMCAMPTDKATMEYIFPELAESEDERVIRTLFYLCMDHDWLNGATKEECLNWLEKQKEPADKGEISDGYHTFNELYYYRMLYNAAFFNLLPKHLVHKSRRHHDGEECFGGGWFIVMAQLPTGQISNHYELKDWDLFQVPEQEKADEWDGHTPKEAAERIFRYLQLKHKPVVWSEEDENKLCQVMETLLADKEIALREYQLCKPLHKAYDDMITFLKSLRPQPKQEWNDEDERILKGIIGKIGHDQSYGVSKDDMLMLLKSIPSRILYARNL